METLPPEIVAEIATHLTVKDLASCCAVSPWWREAFGSDEVWRPRCNRDAEEHLRTTPCRVKPKFEIPQSENSTLSPLGQWRTAYLREKHLWKNWTKGKFVEEIISRCESLFFLNNDFIITVSDDDICLINTKENPSVCVSTINSVPARFVGNIKNDMLIILTYGDTLQVIRVDWESYSLAVERSFCVGKGVIKSVYDVVNNVLVVLDFDLRLHLWDLDKATKLKTLVCLEDIEGIKINDQPCHDERCENLGIIGWKGGYYYFFLYNIKDLKFWPFTKQIPGRIWNFSIVEPYVALVVSEVLEYGQPKSYNIEIYNHHTSQCLHLFNTNLHTIWSMGNSFMFVKQFDKIMKFSLTTRVVTCLELNFKGWWTENNSDVQPKIVDVRYINKNLYIADVFRSCSEFEFEVFITPTSVISPIRFPRVMHKDIGTLNQACSKMGLWNRFNTPNVLRFYW